MDFSKKAHWLKVLHPPRNESVLHLQAGGFLVFANSGNETACTTKAVQH